ncbi:MAG: tyrosine-type recombinase/integrase [Thermoguttaceae bacterium]|jgi:integrase
MADTAPENRRFPFTKTRLEALAVPTSGRAVYYDTKTPGLILRITETGQRSFCFYRKVKGRPLRMLLGRFPQMTVENARKACEAASGSVAAGKDPLAERRAARHEQTFGGLFAFWLEHAKSRKRTWKEDERQYKVFLKPWANRRLSAIKRTDIQALHARVGEKNGIYAANRLLALVRAMFNKAPDMGFSGGNPAVGIQKFKEESRDRFLRPDELKAFFTALLAETELFQAFFTLALLTGARRANVQAMRWEDISFDLGFWRIPDTKSGNPVVVPLSPQAMEILRSHKERCKPGPWVFPSHGKTGHLMEPKSAWKRLLTHAGLSDVRVHDLRRTLGSWQAITGASLPVIGKSLGHSQPSTTAIYSRLTLDPVRESVQKANTAMLQASRGEPTHQPNDNATKPPDSTTAQKPTAANEGPNHG